MVRARRSFKSKIMDGRPKRTWSSLLSLQLIHIASSPASLWQQKHGTQGGSNLEVTGTMVQTLFKCMCKECPHTSVPPAHAPSTSPTYFFQNTSWLPGFHVRFSGEGAATVLKCSLGADPRRTTLQLGKHVATPVIHVQMLLKLIRTNKAYSKLIHKLLFGACLKLFWHFLAN